MLFHIEERMSTVPRWSVVNTIQKQTVDQHSYRVALIAVRVANHLFDIKEIDVLAHVMMSALQHDVIEGITGDTPAYLSSNDLEDQARAKYGDMIPKFDSPYLVSDIVKVADKIEALIFLNREISMGNQSVRKICITIENGLQDLVEDLRKIRRIKITTGEANEYIKNAITNALGGTGCQQDPMEVN